jgi:hypothetical protein
MRSPLVLDLFFFGNMGNAYNICYASAMERRYKRVYLSSCKSCHRILRMTIMGNEFRSALDS